MLDFIQQSIQQLPDLLKAVFLLIFPVFNPESRFYWLHAIAFFLLILGIYGIRESKSRGFSPKELLAYCFPRAIYTQRSAILDYQSYLINGLLKIAASLTILLTLSETTANLVNQSLHELFGTVELQLQETLALGC